jgi:hypothetical protein
MPIEDHPRWPEFKAAIDHLQDAKTAYEKVQHLSPTDATRRTAMAEYGIALLAYNAVAKDIL